MLGISRTRGRTSHRSRTNGLHSPRRCGTGEQAEGRTIALGAWAPSHSAADCQSASPGDCPSYVIGSDTTWAFMIMIVCCRSSPCLRLCTTAYHFIVTFLSFCFFSSPVLTTAHWRDHILISQTRDNPVYTSFFGAWLQNKMSINSITSLGDTVCDSTSRGSSSAWTFIVTPV